MEMDLLSLAPPKNLWPEIILPLDQIPIPEEFNLIETLIEKQIQEGRGEAVAIYYQQERITFNVLNETANRLANSLIALGIRPHDRVGIKLVNQPEALISIFAVQKIGAIPVLFSRLWSKKEDFHAFNSAKIKLYVVSQSLFTENSESSPELKYPELIVVVEEEEKAFTGKEKNIYSYLRLVQKGEKSFKAIKVRRDSIGLIMFTSGTTGLPKGCLHSVGGILAQGYLSNKYVFKIGEHDIITGASSVAFAAGYCIFAVLPFCGQGAVSLISTFQSDAVLQTIQDHHATILTGVPSAYRRLLQYPDFDKYDISSLRLCTTSADAIKETGLEWKNKTGLDIWEGYGASELLFLVAHNRMASQPKPGSCGAALPGWTIKCIDDQGRSLPPGEVGQLIAKGPTGGMYLFSSDEHERLLKAQKEKVRDGWTYTGDMAHIDEEGFIFFASREDDMIKSGGFRIYPGEIEDILLKHSEVKEVCVLGVPDQVRGNNVVACVVFEKEVSNFIKTEEELISLCRDNLAVYKIPRSFKFINELPRTATGKLMRNRVRDIIISDQGA